VYRLKLLNKIMKTMRNKLKVKQLQNKPLFAYICIVLMSISPLTAHAVKKSTVKFGSGVFLAVDYNRDGIVDFDKTQITPNDLLNGKKLTDKTSETARYKIWLNNDAEEVAQLGRHTNDQNASSFFTITDKTLPGIQGTRDLEDFFGLSIKLPKGLGDDLEVRLEISEGITLRLYEGAWPLDKLLYMSDKTVAKEQSEKFTIGLLRSGRDIIIPNTKFENERYNLIFEGVDASNDSAIGTIKLIVKYKENDEASVAEDSVFIDVRDIKRFYEHYTVGDTSDSGVAVAATASQINSNYAEPGIAIPGFTDQYIVFVHGWRMKPWERRVFAETAMKRLFWQGYKGKFGFFSWPTEYTAELGAGSYDQLNYDRSDVQARFSGLRLMNLVNSGALSSYKGKLRIFAHSMGNVVVSESLRSYKGNNGVLYNTYVASQAAESAQAYVDEADTSFAPLGVPISWPTAWSGLNAGDPPPNRFLYDVPNPHTPGPSEDWGPRYYDGISAGVAGGRIISFYNTDDSAMSKYDLNQLTKPDTSISLSWSYEREAAPVTIPGGTTFGYLDYYYRDPLGNVREEIFWGDGSIHDGVYGPAEILSNITPSRSRALGTSNNTTGEILLNLNLFAAPYNFADVHSAQFLDDNIQRNCYWDQLLQAFAIDHNNMCTN